MTFQGYSIKKVLARNQRHEVLLAHREEDGEQVVLKQSIFKNSDANKSKLGHEFDILKQLRHDGIPEVHEVVLEGERIALVQEYIDGLDLKETLIKNELSFDEVLDIAIQLSEILHFVHQSGVIHKDINPRNVMLTRDGKVKLIDFAISSNLLSESHDVLIVDQIEGTLNYISPEQTGRTAYSVQHHCDFYSLGVLLYELVAGKPPFDSVDPLEIIHFHLSRKPKLLSSLMTELPDGLDRVIDKLLEKNPEDRYNSAIGLRSDLELIRNHHETGKTLMDFIPGRNDISHGYKQSQKLYGRENEKARLISYFDSLPQSGSVLALIAGYSGVGKSALVNHVKFPIIQKGGRVLSGKFDQFKKGIPYYAFIEGIQEFIKTLFSQSDQEIEQWRERIQGTLGDNVGLIIEVIPLLSKIIKDYPSIPKLQPAEQESRFNMVLLDFISIFGTEDRPLVFFLDDLQWADLSSLNLMKRILENKSESNILLLGAYRDNEVETGHPLLITLRQINAVNDKVHTIHLNPLDEKTTTLIVSDAFKMEQNETVELGRTVYKKTKGNPFFIHSFLKSLYDKKLVKPHSNGNWTFDSNEIDLLGYTENVIDLMTEGLIVLPMETQEVLKLGSVLGNTFKLKELVQVTGQSPAGIYETVKIAIREGYIQPLDQKYRSLALSSVSNEMELEIDHSDLAVQFIFTHDKVQQAAYNLIEKNALPGLHLKIGRLLLKSKGENQLSEDIFEVVNHYAMGIDLVTDQEKERISRLCLAAGKKAKESISYDLGVQILEMGKGLLSENSWSENYELTFEILKELGECEYLNNNKDKAEIHFKEVLSHSKTNFDKLQIYYIHSSLYLKIGNTQESLRLGLEAVKLYGIRFPKNKKLIEITALVTVMKYLFLFSTKYSNSDRFFDIPDSKDEENIALNKFLIDLATSAYQQDQNLMMLVIFKIIKLFIKNGFTDASGWGFSGFSVVVLSALKIPSRGFKLWDLTIKLHQKTHSPLIKWRLSYTVLAFHNPWRVPFEQSYDDILETIKACTLNGDQIFTGYSVALHIRTAIIGGKNLNEIYQVSSEQMSLIEITMGGLDFFSGFYQVVKYLLGKTDPGSWNDSTYNGEKTLQRLKLEGNQTKLGFYHTARLMHHYYAHKYREALLENEILNEYMDNFPGDTCEALKSFYHALSIAACFEELDSQEKKKSLKDLKSHLKDFKRWSRGSSANYQQHYELLYAEYCSVTNKFEEAQKFYEKAIQTASVGKIPYVEAIANERAATLCQRKGLRKQSLVYLKDAWNAYSAWGAVQKCRKLENNFPELGKEKAEEKMRQPMNVNSLTSTSSRSELDLASVLKASQSIASQVKYVDLLKRLLHITIENAGAERGVLMNLKNGELCIEAEGISGDDQIKIHDSIRFDRSDLVPHSFVNFSWRSEESQVVNNASNEERFNQDPYVQQNKSVSLMCVPLTSQGKINGLLYLENNMLKGVFNRNRINLLQMLSGQMGISIDNAILYENLEEKVKERTREIEKQKVEIEKEKDKSDALLLNILPKNTAEELKSTGGYKAQSYSHVAVMFIDIVGFTRMGEKLTADDLVNELDTFFSGLDDIITKYDIEKIKTIGDAYLCAAGLDERTENLPTIQMVKAAQEILGFMKQLNEKKKKFGRPVFEIRLGIHSGPVTAGVVGKSKYAYDIWGDTVNTAARIESSSEPGRINISGDAYTSVKDEFKCEYRGKIQAKSKGEIDMYFVLSQED